MAGLIARNKAAATTYKSLDERINLVAGKVIMMMMVMAIMIMINLVAGKVSCYQAGKSVMASAIGTFIPSASNQSIVL